MNDVSPKWLYEYDDIKGEAHRIEAKSINSYLLDAPNMIIGNRLNPLCAVPAMGVGSQPIDDGNYLFSEKEKNEFLQVEPEAKKYFKRWLGAHEFINGYCRYFLWLGNASPSELKAMPEIVKRIEAVKKFRLASSRQATRKLSETPTKMAFETILQDEYLIVPKVSSERRLYIPVGFVSPDTFVSDLVFVIPNAKIYHFGIISSIMHNAWMRTISGKLKSDYRYSAKLVYNNFPWPENPSDKQKAAIETAAQGVLDARAQFPDSTLADLYDPLTMPPVLLKAHQALDKAVDAAYGKTHFKSEAERVAFLFGLYREMVPN